MNAAFWKRQIPLLLLIAISFGVIVYGTKRVSNLYALHNKALTAEAQSEALLDQHKVLQTLKAEAEKSVGLLRSGYSSNLEVGNQKYSELLELNCFLKDLSVAQQVKLAKYYKVLMEVEHVERTNRVKNGKTPSEEASNFILQVKAEQEEQSILSPLY